MSRSIACRLALPLAVATLTALPDRTTAGQGAITDRQRADANRLIEASLTDTVGDARLAALTDTFGHRLREHFITVPSSSGR